MPAVKPVSVATPKTVLTSLLSDIVYIYVKKVFLASDISARWIKISLIR